MDDIERIVAAKLAEYEGRRNALIAAFTASLSAPVTRRQGGDLLSGKANPAEAARRHAAATTAALNALLKREGPDAALAYAHSLRDASRRKTEARSKGIDRLATARQWHGRYMA